MTLPFVYVKSWLTHIFITSREAPPPTWLTSTGQLALRFLRCICQTLFICTVVRKGVQRGATFKVRSLLLERQYNTIATFPHLDLWVLNLIDAIPRAGTANP